MTTSPDRFENKVTLAGLVKFEPKSLGGKGVRFLIEVPMGGDWNGGVDVIAWNSDVPNMPEIVERDFVEVNGFLKRVQHTKTKAWSYEVVAKSVEIVPHKSATSTKGREATPSDDAPPDDVPF